MIAIRQAAQNVQATVHPEPGMPARCAIMARTDGTDRCSDAARCGSRNGTAYAYFYIRVLSEANAVTGLKEDSAPSARIDPKLSTP